MGFFLDTAYRSLKKHGEELCGDQVAMERVGDRLLIVMSDGLGSGVKANILATLTARIAVTMLKEGASLEGTVDTIARTLPVCSVRNLAYSTFTVIEAFDDGRIHTVEFDNPAYILTRKTESEIPEKTMSSIAGKSIWESNFKMDDGDFLTVVSDGVLYASQGMILDQGWGWEDIRDFLKDSARAEKSASALALQLSVFCNVLYDLKPGDDATVLTLAVRKKEGLTIFTGPPLRLEDDKKLAEAFLNASGKVAISGGTTAATIARETGREIEAEISDTSELVPPTSRLEGADIVTEGALTLARTADLLEEFLNPTDDDIFLKLRKRNGAARLARMIIDSSELTIWLGSAVNLANSDTHLRSVDVMRIMEAAKSLGRNTKLVMI